MRKAKEVDDIDKAFAQSVFYVEKEIGGVFIDDTYPLMKFFSQVEHLKEHFENERKEYEKSQRKTKTLR